MEPRFHGALRTRVEEVLNTELADLVDAVAHKLTPGQRIRQHNDFIPNNETHRLTVQVNRGLDTAAGGWFVLFSGPEPANIHKVLLPGHNSALGFAISRSSFHAVSSVPERLRGAMALGHLVPSLGATVARLVRSIHVLRAPGPEYDIARTDCTLARPNPGAICPHVFRIFCVRRPVRAAFSC